MNIYEIFIFSRNLFEIIKNEINLGDIIVYTILGYLFSFLFFVTFMIFFHKDVIAKFFSNSLNEYGRPFLFYLVVLWLVSPGIMSLSALLISSLYVIFLIKFLGYLEKVIGETILKIIGAFVFIRFFLSPIGYIKEIEISLMISVIIVTIPLLTIISYEKGRIYIKNFLGKITRYIRNWITQEELLFELEV